MKEKLEKLFETANAFHTELTALAIELDTAQIWQSEGSMQDVKAYMVNAYEELLEKE